MKISLILPYWDRKAAADAALARLDALYGDLDIEVIIVDDGNRVRYVPPPGKLDVRVIYMPTKYEPKSPCTCWNEGARAATGEILAISCIEILHDEPVLEQLAEQVRALGPRGYALAAAFCPETGEWHCHSTYRASGAPELPKGFGRAFLGLMHRDLYAEAGGWDDEYREGAGYEDIDFARRLARIGAVPVIRDDLVVIHPKRGATIAWPAAAFARNKALLERKWETVTFCCVQAGNYAGDGARYVNTLFDMVARHLPDESRFRFVCLTDNREGLDPRIEVRALPEDLEGWWGKLYLFKRGLFPDGARMVFMDLDTVILGKLDNLVAYRGKFATLQDFLYPDRLGPAVIAWEAGEYVASIWEYWVAAGKPRHPNGDLWWLNNIDDGRFAKRVDRLQNLFPKQFVSFKAHCTPLPPKGARVVCFHGKPRPHACEVPWVKEIWRVGGGTLSALETVPNTEHERVVSNVKTNAARDLPQLDMIAPHDGHAVIVAGGPSVAANLDEIRWRQGRGQTVIALNGAASYLERNGIVADWQVILDARPDNARFLNAGVKRLWLCSQCDPTLFEKAAVPVTVYHVNTAATLEALEGGREAHLISTGSTVFLITMGIVFVQGFRAIHCYGVDSSYTTDHHAYEQKMNDSDRVVEATAGGRTFKCAPWMVAQAEQFQEVARQLAEADCVITVAGDGLLPHIARLMSQPEELAA